MLAVYYFLLNVNIDIGLKNPVSVKVSLGTNILKKM